MKISDILVGKKCPICGKIFYCEPCAWAYKAYRSGKPKYYCTWSCLVKAKKARIKKTQEKI